MRNNFFLIIILFLASFFCLKDILLFTSTVRDSVCYSIDIEEESSEENEKGDIDEKDDLEKWHPNSSHKLSEINSLTKIKIQNHTEKRYSTPNSEIYSPPPELV
jgi:hypothetical protein